MTAKNPAERLARLERLRAREPRTHAFARLSELHRAEGDLERALAVAREGLALHPHYLAARRLLARLLLETGRAAEARAEYELILRIDPGDPAALAALDPATEPPPPATPEANGAGWLARLDAAWRSARGGGLGSTAPAPAAIPGATIPGAAVPASASAVPAGTAPTPASDAAAPLDAELDTPTMAELYASQGLFEQAIGVCERILARDPANEPVRADLERLRRRAAPGPTAREEIGSILDGSGPGRGSWREWLAGLDERDRVGAAVGAPVRGEAG